MRESSLNMYKNLIQLSKLKGCRIVSKKRSSFSAELWIRNGRYQIRLDYFVKSIPNVYVISPTIDMREPLEIHTFGMKFHGAYQRELPLLCLTHYETDRWNTSIMLLESYIPWAVEWTEFYELWLMTGKWYGGGIHPGGEKDND